MNRRCSSRHHRDYERDDRRRRGSRAEYDGYSRDWDEPYPQESLPYHERERSTSVYREERDPREKRERPAYDDRLYEERAEKVCTCLRTRCSHVAHCIHSAHATMHLKHLLRNRSGHRNRLSGQRLRRKEKSRPGLLHLAVPYDPPCFPLCSYASSNVYMRIPRNISGRHGIGARPVTLAVVLLLVRPR